MDKTTGQWKLAKTQLVFAFYIFNTIVTISKST